MPTTKHIYVDGPWDGVTRRARTSPPTVDVATISGPLIARWVRDEDTPTDPLGETHRYIKQYQTRQGTWVYEHYGRTS